MCNAASLAHQTRVSAVWGQTSHLAEEDTVRWGEGRRRDYLKLSSYVPQHTKNSRSGFSFTNLPKVKVRIQKRFSDAWMSNSVVCINFSSHLYTKNVLTSFLKWFTRSETQNHRQSQQTHIIFLCINYCGGDFIYWRLLKLLLYRNTSRGGGGEKQGQVEGVCQGLAL